MLGQTSAETDSLSSQRQCLKGDQGVPTGEPVRFATMLSEKEH